MASSSTMRLASSGLREIRLHLCQSSAASAGVRDFVSKHYIPLKEQNPTFPILVRECSGIAPRIWARYAFGQEKNQDLSNFNADQVLQAVYSMAKS